MAFFDFDWGKDDLMKVVELKKKLVTRDATISAGVTGIILGCTVTARGRALSPSRRFEKLWEMKSKAGKPVRPTVLDLNDATWQAWDMVVDQAEASKNNLADAMGALSPRNFDREGTVNEKLAHRLNHANESFMDLWVTTLDFVTGFRSTINKLLRHGEAVAVADYLHRGIARSEIMAAYDAEFPPDAEDGK